MICYQILEETSESSIIHSFVKKDIISLNKATVSIEKINKEKVASKDLNKDLTMVKQQGLTNILIGEDVKEVMRHE